MNINDKIREYINKCDFYCFDMMWHSAINDFGLVYSLTIPLQSPISKDEFSVGKFTLTELSCVLEDELGITGDWVVYFRYRAINIQFKSPQDQLAAFLRFDGSDTKPISYDTNRIKFRTYHEYFKSNS